MEQLKSNWIWLVIAATGWIAALVITSIKIFAADGGHWSTLTAGMMALVASAIAATAAYSIGARQVRQSERQRHEDIKGARFMVASYLNEG